MLPRARPIFAALILLGTTTAPLPASDSPATKERGATPGRAPEASMPQAIGFRSAYQVYLRTRPQSPWCRLLVVYQKARPAIEARAYCVFIVDGRLWTYDQFGGSQRAWITEAEKNDAGKLGRQVAGKTFVRAVWVDSPL